MKKYVQVGLGQRSEMYITAITETYKNNCQLVGLCDTNRGRLELRRNDLKKICGLVPIYHAKDFDKMVKETKPDIVIVTTKDCFHDKYIVRAMELGCDVITEKPMTIDEKRCQKIIDAVKRTKRKVRVTFNYRYSPVRTQIKELVSSGIIGEILSVDFNWLLNTRHGADYYRRWHRERKNSGGLMVHKATHHFDIVNWWISSYPVEVFAIGKRDFYLPDRANQYGLKGHGERCFGCRVSSKCPFYLDLRKRELHKRVYLDNEKYDGYFRDKCVFGKEINIEDSMNLVVRYKNSVLMSYSLNSFCPWEGYTIRFNGTKGSLEHKSVETVYISGDGTTPGETVKGETNIKISPHFKPAYNVKTRISKGGHGGGDEPLLESLFSPKQPKDKFKKAASFVEGAWSILTGISANISMKTGKPVYPERLVKGLSEPNYSKNRDL
ncbi:MAG: Gfo/Idh/MocA family oxidoreductase [bacterium]